MEGLINPKRSDLNIPYFIFDDYSICDVAGIKFVEKESQKFGIKEKIEKLDLIVDNIINKLENLSSENKESFISNIKNKKNILKDLLSKYRAIEKKYIEDDQFYRENLFEFYKNKYDVAPLFSFADKRLYFASMIDIQILLKKKFEDFCEQYYNIRNEFFEINDYLLKIKKLFKIDS